MLNNKFASTPNKLEAIIKDTKKINFDMMSENNVGILLKTLSATKTNGKFLELGTGSGVSTSWILEGMDSTSSLITMDNNNELLKIAKKHLGEDNRLEIICEDGDVFVNNLYNNNSKFDFIFADTWSGKYKLIEETLSMLNIGGIYIIDDMLKQDNWPKGHDVKVNRLINYLHTRNDLSVVELNWSCGIIICTKLGEI